MATVYIDNRRIPDESGAESAASPVSRWASICPISAGIRRWARLAHAASAPSSSSRTSTTRKASIVMACMTPAAEGTRISIDDPEAAAFRAGIIEGLMLNHPHDCPVCDEGGECHLQDMTVMTGHDYRRYRFDQAHVPQSVSRPVGESRDEPLHPVLPVRAVLSRVRGGRDLNAFALRDTGLFRPARRWRSGKRVQRQSGRSLPDGRIHGQDAEAPLHAQVGPAVRAFRLRPLRTRAATSASANATVCCGASSIAINQRSERLLSVRPRALRLRIREQRAAHPPAQTARREQSLRCSQRRP